MPSDHPLRALVVAEPDQDLVEHDGARDRDAVDRPEPIREPPSERAAPFDEVGEPVAAELAQRGPRHESAGAAR